MKGIETFGFGARGYLTLRRSDHCPAMKGIETRKHRIFFSAGRGSDHCPAMKGIETSYFSFFLMGVARSDHCPAMKGIETRRRWPQPRSR